MGSCISKCMPIAKTQPQFDQDYDQFVHDKLVILQPAPSFKTQSTNTISHSKPGSTSSFSTASNRSSSIFSSGSTSSCSSSLSTASSALSPRDHRSFSNDFLRSCVKENPHILRLGSVQELVHGQEVESPIKPIMFTAPSKMSIPQRVPSPSRPAVEKRVRPSSPTLTRQKSMRVTEPEGFGYSTSRAILRSPSPSRRLTSSPTQMEIIGGSNRLVASSNYKTNKVSPLSSSLRKENIRVACPNNNPGRVRACLSSRDHALSSHQTRTVQDILGTSEDIDNPLISLDCFIFI